MALSPKSVAAVLIVAGVLLASGVALSASDPVRASVGANGFVEIEGAVASLESAGGPASQHAWRCNGPSGLSATCGVNLPSTAGTDPSAPSWVNLTARTSGSPGGSVAASMTWDTSDGYVLLYGGLSGIISYPAVGPYEWTYLNGAWTNISGLVTGGSPPGVAFTGLAYDPAIQKVVAFGGIGNGGTSYNATWLYHDDTWTNVTATAGPAPSPRVYMGFSEDSSAGEIVLFGGSPSDSASTYYNDTWTFSDGTWTNLTATAGISTPLAAFPGLSDDPAASSAVLVYLTLGPANYSEDTFLFTGTAWTNVTGSVTGTLPLVFLPQMAYDAQESAVVLFALDLIDQTGTEIFMSATYEFSHDAWINLTGSAPLATNYSLTLSDPLLPSLSELPDGTVGLYGGAQPTFGLLFDYFQVLATAPNVSRVLPSSSTAEAGTVVPFDFSAGGGISPLSYSYAFGDGGGASGFPSATHQYSSAGPYQVTFTATDLGGRTAVGQVNLTVTPALATSPISTASSALAPNAIGVFSVSVSGGAPPYAYAWTFGDGASSPAAAPSHAWTSTGTYTVRVNVTDAGGASVVQTLVVDVTNSASSSSSSSISALDATYLVVVAVVALAAGVLIGSMIRRGRPPTPAPPPPAAT